MTDIEFCAGCGVKTSHSKVFKCLKRVFNFKNLFTTHYSQFTKAIAFTLAETLIVMGIIGVVAALTLPNLNSSTGDKEKVAKVKKIYQNLNDAFGRAEAVYGPFDEWFVNDTTNAQKSKRFGERMTEFMKISKDNGDYSYILSDGAGLGFRNMISSDFESSDYITGATYFGCIWVDIDGPNKGKNKDGNDKFIFDVTDQGIYPEGLSENDLSQCFNNGYCTRWVVEKGNMDYLKADNSGKCKNNNSITLNWTTNTTCK